MKATAGSTKEEHSTPISATWSKFLTAQAEWPDKDEFLDVIYWLRQFVGIVLGLIWGVIPLTGMVGLILFLLCNAGCIYFYSSVFQKVDDEEYGGIFEIACKEGFMTSFAGFLVTWIIIYTGLHYADTDLQSFVTP